MREPISERETQRWHLVSLQLNIQYGRPRRVSNRDLLKKVLLDRICEINGYKSVTDVSADHPPHHMGRPVVWIEMIAAPDAFVAVDNRNPDGVSRVALADDVCMLYPARPEELDGSQSAESLASMLGFHMCNHVKMLAMGTWGPPGGVG